MALAPVLGPLIAAFHKGIDQIPYTQTPFSTIWEKRQFHGVVVRNSSDMGQYDVTMDDGGSGQSSRYYGAWQGTKASPLPDDFSLHGWQSQATHAGGTAQPFATLGELRKKQGSTP